MARRVRVVIGAVAALLIGACVEGDAEVTSGQSGAEVAGIPQDETVLNALVTNRTGWVLTGGGTSDEAGPATMWRVDTSGAATEVETLRGEGWAMATNGSEVFAVSSGCDVNDDSCGTGDRALLWVFDDEGTKVDGAEFDRADEGGDVAATIVGTAEENLWVVSSGTSGGLKEVAPSGEIRQEVDRGGGLHCVIDGQLFATSTAPGPQTDGESPPAEAAGPGEMVGQTHEYSVSRLADGRWQSAGSEPIPVAGDEDLTCTPQGIERFSFDETPAVPNAFWTPEAGLEPVTAPADGPTSVGGPPVVTAHGELYIVDETGQLAVRQPGTAEFEAQPGARIAESTDNGPVTPIYDASSTLEVSCVGSGEERASMSCEVAGR